MRGRYPFVVLAVLSLLLAGGSVLFTTYYVRANNHKFCLVVQGYASAKPGPSTQAGVSRVNYFAELGQQLGCRG